MQILIAVGAGGFVGTIIGFILCAILSAGKQADNCQECQYEHTKQ